RDHAPGVYRETARFCTLGGFIAYQLGVSSSTDRTQASATCLLDVNEADWSSEVLRAAGLALSKLPEVRPAGTLLGPLASAVCRDLGLTGRPIAVLGADDLACTSLGAGVVRPGQALYYLGSRFHLVPLYEATPIRRMLYLRGLETWQHLPVGLLTSPVHYDVGGNALSWFLDVLSPLERREAVRMGQNPYDVLLAQMSAAPAKPLIVPGDAQHPGSVSGLTIGTKRGDLVRALLEGLALQTLDGQERLLEVGIPIALYRAAGGGSRSARWLQLTADVTGYAVERTAEEWATALGAALIAAMGAGAFPDLPAASSALVRVVDRYEPDTALHTHYQARSAQFRTQAERCATLATFDKAEH
ncbi:MAG: FGGY-family carbohydrate kinase, partial [Anaerolineales bacterium]